RGVVDRRPDGSENPNLSSGEVAIDVTSFEVLGEAAALPFQLDDEVGEEARLRHRYLDLRREAPGAALRLRSKVNAAARGVMARHDLVEHEITTITRSNAEGDRALLVP